MIDLLDSDQNLFIDGYSDYFIRYNGIWYNQWKTEGTIYRPTGTWAAQGGTLYKSMATMYRDQIIPLPEEWLIRLVADKLAGKVLE